MKKIACVPAALLLSACMSSEMSPELEANIARNAVVAENAAMVQSAAGPMRINVNNSRVIAMVTGVPGMATVAQMEAAAAAHTGCSAQAATNITQLMGVDKTTPVSDDHYRQFGGAIPIRLSC